MKCVRKFLTNCVNDITYTITGTPIEHGGSSILYPASRKGKGLCTKDQLVIKECFLVRGNYMRKKGKICPVSEDLVQQKKDEECLELLYESLREECRIGQIVAERSDRIIVAEMIPEVQTIVTQGQTWTVTNCPFLVMEKSVIRECF